MIAPGPPIDAPPVRDAPPFGADIAPPPRFDSALLQCSGLWSPGAACTGVLPRSCDELYQWGVRTSGPYQMDPDGSGAASSFVSFCDMQSGVGGWTLIAKVNTADMDNVPEARNWFRTEARTDALASRGFAKNQPPSSHGSAKLLPLVRAGSLTRFDLHAEADTSQSARWYKVVASPSSFTAWFSTDNTPSRVCTDVGLTMNCSNDIIAGRTGIYDATTLGGMDLAHYGFSALGDIHMRLEGDPMVEASGVCSVTFDRNNNAWHDRYLGHWGNGLLIWLK